MPSRRDASIVWRLNCIHKRFRDDAVDTEPAESIQAGIILIAFRAILSVALCYCRFVRLHPRFFSDILAENSNEPFHVLSRRYDSSLGSVAMTQTQRVHRVACRVEFLRRRVPDVYLEFINELDFSVCINKIFSNNVVKVFEQIRFKM